MNQHTRDEGLTKFESRLHDNVPPPEWDLEEINTWRDKLHALGYIGAYDDGVGYGNISLRARYTKEFIVTGTSTGKIALLFPEHFTRVQGYDLEKNTVVCEGKIHASSESMTHAAIYDCCPKIRAVIHIHSMDHWKQLLNRIPTTSPSAKYGSPEMCAEIIRVYKETDFPNIGVLAMGGHEEGIISFGKNLDEAGERLFDVLGNTA